MTNIDQDFPVVKHEPFGLDQDINFHRPLVATAFDDARGIL